MRIALLALLALAACDETAPGAPVPVAQVKPDEATMQAAAEQECAQMTGYAPDKSTSQTPEMQALVEREYKLCVENVTKGTPQLRGRN